MPEFKFTTSSCSIFMCMHVSVCWFSCLSFNLPRCVRARAPERTCVSACSAAMMALFRMIDVLEGAARSSGWARASVWHTAASLLLYICRRSKTSSPLPLDCASRSKHSQHSQVPSFRLYFEAPTKLNLLLWASRTTSCFTFYSWASHSRLFLRCPGLI